MILGHFKWFQLTLCSSKMVEVLAFSPWTGVPRQLSTNEQIFSESLPVVWGKQVGFLGTLDFGCIEESKDKMKKSSEKTFVTSCTIRSDSRRILHGVTKVFSEDFLLGLFDIGEVVAFLIQLEEIRWRFV